VPHRRTSPSSKLLLPPAHWRALAYYMRKLDRRRPSKVASRITSKCERRACAYLSFQLNQRRAWRVSDYKLKKTKNQKMTASHLTVSSHRQPRCRWPCTGLRSICRGKRRELDETRERRGSDYKKERRGSDLTSSWRGTCPHTPWRLVPRRWQRRGSWCCWPVTKDDHVAVPSEQGTVLIGQLNL
jgi:hypothetical protein